MKEPLYLIKFDNSTLSYNMSDNGKQTRRKSNLLVSVENAEINTDGNFTGNILFTPITYDSPTGKVVESVNMGKLYYQNIVLRKDIVSLPLVGSDYVLDPDNFIHTIKQLTINEEVLDNNITIYYLDMYYKWSTTKATFEQIRGKFYIFGKIADLSFYNSSRYSVQAITEAYRFNINPQNVIQNYAKIINKTVTNTGMSFQFWGNDAITFDVKGKTLAMLITENDYYKSTYSVNPQLETEAYKYLESLKRWYLEQNNKYNPTETKYRVGFYYRGKLYMGHFESFSLTDDAEKPTVLDYNFRFTSNEEVDYRNVDFSQINNRVM